MDTVKSFPVIFGAGNETRTRDPNLGKVVLYQLSYSRLQRGHEFYRLRATCQLLKALFAVFLIDFCLNADKLHNY